MATSQLAVIVLAAGMGTRMKSDLPKVMHPLAGRPMVRHLMDTISGLNPDKVVVVVGPGMEQVAQAVAPAHTVVQAERLGTGHAVMQARATTSWWVKSEASKEPSRSRPSRQATPCSLRSMRRR